MPDGCFRTNKFLDADAALSGAALIPSSSSLRSPDTGSLLSWKRLHGTLPGAILARHLAVAVGWHGK
jgi:hypothetical protein